MDSIAKKTPLRDRLNSNSPSISAISRGSDVEIARCIVVRLRDLASNCVVSDGGTLYAFDSTHWRILDDDYLRGLARDYDGASYYDEKEKLKTISLNKSRIDSILNEVKSMLSLSSITGDIYRADKSSFFDSAVPGINLANGFLYFHSDGSIELIEHNPDFRQRHVLPAFYSDLSFDGCSDFILPESSLLYRLLDGCFRDDPHYQEKIDLLQEVFGCAISRFSTRLKKAKFVLLYGQTANNGKSQILDMLSSLLPPDCVTSVPVEEWGNEHYRVALRDSVVNIVGELSGSMIQSNVFKSIVTGDIVGARDLYKSAVYFRPTALHVAATNKLPVFSGGVDRGVAARLLPIEFTRSIPKDEQIENIGRKIVAEELDLLFAWAIHGARRLIARGDYPDIASTSETLEDWTRQVDPVLDWLRECCVVDPGCQEFLPNGVIAQEFQAWATKEAYSPKYLPQGREIIARIVAQGGVTRTRNANTRGLLGLKIHTLHARPEGY